MKLNKKKLISIGVALLLTIFLAVMGGQSVTDALLDFAGIGGYEDSDNQNNSDGSSGQQNNTGNNQDGTSSGDSSGSGNNQGGSSSDDQPAKLDESGFFYSAKDVGLYLHQYGKLPTNFITKTEAQKLGWTGGSVEKYKPGYAIGGDTFSNREGQLPKADGRKYYECDIDTNGGKARGAKRIVFSNDGLIYYTTDHYESFMLLYGGTAQ